MVGRLRDYRRGLSVGLLTLMIGATSGLRAQDGAPSPVQKNESKPQDAADESPDSKGEPKTPADAVPAKVPGSTSILDLDIEQLGKVQAKVPTVFDAEVTTVTANKSTIGKSPAAVFVITNEMIRRSGATSIPETFRMVPGMQVAKIGPSKWAISARGFNDQFSNKLLVLVDGRSVYTPFFGGVYWESQDLMLQDIERIEVIRGPGATVWGANAVNGVINIITKKSDDTPGALVSSGGGDQDQNINAVRYGGKIGEDAHYRVYAKSTERAAGFNPTGANDDWRTVRGGFRVDWDDPDHIDQLTLQGAIFSMDIGEKVFSAQPAPPFFFQNVIDGHMGGGNILGRWKRTVSDDNSFYIQAFYDRNERVDTAINFAIDIYDVEFRQNLTHSENHTFTWGVGYRLIHDNITGVGFMNQGVSPQERTYDLASAFLQEEIPFLRDDLKLIFGSKFLSWYFTGFEYQPSARMLWEIDDGQVVWGAVSRAVRTPARFNEDARLTVAAPPAPAFLMLNGGGRNLVSEELVAYELGYRRQVTDTLSFEAATFYNVYRDVINAVPSGFTPGFPSIIQLQLQNVQNAQTYGVELNGQWEVTEKWKVRSWYSFLRMQVEGPSPQTLTGVVPINQAYLMSSWDLPCKFELDMMARYVDNLPAKNVPSYSNLDVRLGWRPNVKWEFSIIGQNLLAPHHLEFVGSSTARSEVNRGVYAQVVWRH